MSIQENEKIQILSEYEQILSDGYAVQLAPQGWSMYPLISDGRDEVIIVPLGERQLRRADVVLYRREQSILVLHRIHHINKKGIYLVGDNQKEIEGPLRPEQMRGIMHAVIRNGHMIKVNQPLYLLYSHIWLILRPFRPFLSKTAAKIKRSIKKKQPQK